MAKGGAKYWYFPDGYLPERNTDGSLESHEALMILNVQKIPAEIQIDIYFEDGADKKSITVQVGSESVKTIRTDCPEELQGIVIPALTQYALRVRSDTEVVVQFGRLDATQQNLAYYSSMGFCE